MTAAATMNVEVASLKFFYMLGAFGASIGFMVGLLGAMVQ